MNTRKWYKTVIGGFLVGFGAALATVLGKRALRILRANGIGRTLMALVVRNRGDKYMPFGFDRRKAIQAVAFLLGKRPDATDKYARLLKILYMADRESLKETGTPITGDRFVCMKHGTMLSRLLNLVKHEQSAVLTKSDYVEWDRYFERQGYYIRLVSDPGVSTLCKYEIDKLSEVADRYKDYTWTDMKRETHALPEYHDPGDSSDLISLREFLIAVGMGEMADQIIEDAEDCASLAKLAGR